MGERGERGERVRSGGREEIGFFFLGSVNSEGKKKKKRESVAPRIRIENDKTHGFLTPAGIEVVIPVVLVEESTAAELQRAQKRRTLRAIAVEPPSRRHRRRRRCRSISFFVAGSEGRRGISLLLLMRIGEERTITSSQAAHGSRLEEAAERRGREKEFL